MAIALDTSQSNASLGASPVSFSYTCTGSDRLLMVGLLTYGDNVDRITGVTYNGVSMTRLATVSHATDRRIYTYYLLNPASGANNVTVTHTDASGDVHAITQSYTGVSQSGFPDASVTNSSAGATSLAGTVTTIADNCWLYGYYNSSSGGTSGVGANTTQRQIQFNTIIGADSNAAQTPAGSYSQNFTNPDSVACGVIVASFAPVVAAGGAVRDARFLTLLGVG